MHTRDFLRLAGLTIASRIVPSPLLNLWAAAKENRRPQRKVILVTFGGGVRYSETFAPTGLANIPHLAKLRPQGHFYAQCQNNGVLSHFNSTGSIVTGNWQRVDDFGFQPPASPTIFELYRKASGAGPMDAWVVATNKSFAAMGHSSQPSLGLPFGANVVLPKQLLLDAVKEIVERPTRQNSSRPNSTQRNVADRDAIHAQLRGILEEGYEGVGWTIFKGNRGLDAKVRTTLTKALGEFIHGPEMPSSGDELTFFISREVMREFAPRLLLVNFWDMDVAHWGSYSLYLQAITRTDRLVGMLWDEVQSNPHYKDQTTLLVLPELGRDGDANTANGFLNHRSGDASCRNMWMLALGQGIPAGATDRPIAHVDMAATAAAILGLSPAKLGASLQGQPLPEVLL